MLIKRGLLLAAAGLITLTTGDEGPLLSRPPRPDRPGGTRVVAPRAQIYTVAQKEFFLSQEELDYIRPGFHIVVNSVSIPADNKPLVDFNYYDDLNQPLDRAGQVTPGALSFSFIIAWWDPGNRYYTSYITRTATAAPPSTMVGATATQAATDSGGTFTDLALGHSTYKFGKALPAAFDQTKTTTLGIYATRDTSDIVGKDYYANVEYDFRPDGGTVTDVWDKIAPTACATCHDPLSAHGGSRRDVKLCVLCHQPQTTDPDTGNTVDFKVMIHKIHRGENLPSVVAGTPYQIIGFQQSVNDFSTVVFPQDVRNCTVCHAPPATQAPNWYTYPTRAACGSCHDNINWVSGSGHPAGPQADDSQCASCHAPQGSREWDASITGAHTVPSKSSQLKGLNAAILSVSNTAPGQNPTVVFTLTQNDGTHVTPASLGSNLNLLMGGPSTDYGAGQNSPAQPFRENASGAAYDAGTGKATYTFTNAVPPSATGTWAFTLEARRSVTLSPAPSAGPTSINEGADNPVAYAAVTDSAAVPRRAVVDIALCNVCHDRLALHGTQRFKTEMCVICHNPNADDSGRRPADQGPPESIDFKRMIHRIHNAGNLTQNATRPYIIYGFGNPPSKNDFSDIGFPGDTRDCTKCHIAGTQNVMDADPDGLIPTVTQRDWYTPMQHYAAACLGCHDSKAAAAHAYIMFAPPIGESCAACHGSDDTFSVDKAHAR
jgi:OmcA/MtrC family decaheme c-type cytochrome